MLKEFKAFLTKSNALALAVGVIIGAGIAKIVSALSDDLLMPVIGPLLPAGDWRQAKVVLESVTDASGKVTENAILYGHFLGAVIDFILIAFVVFLIVRAMLAPAAATRDCPECMETIPASAKRCRACGSLV